MRRLHFQAFTSIVVSLSLGMAGLPLVAQHPDVEKLNQMFSKTSLRENRMPPWHLRMTIHLYDESGKNAVDGSYEEWHISEKKAHSKLSLPGYTWEEPVEEIEPYTRESYLADLLIDEVTYRSQDLSLNNLSSWIDQSVQLRAASYMFGNERLDCLIRTIGKVQLWMACSDPGQPVLRLLESEGWRTVHNQVEPFLGKQIPHDVSVLCNGRHVISGHIDVLEKLDPSTVTVNMGDSGEDLDDSESDNLETVHAQKPDLSGINGGDSIKGTVLVGVSVADGGTVASTFVISSPSPELSAASLQAAQAWRFKPYKNRRPHENRSLAILFDFSH